jgi:hypothetical protein
MPPRCFGPLHGTKPSGDNKYIEPTNKRIRNYFAQVQCPIEFKASTSSLRTGGTPIP